MWVCLNEEGMRVWGDVFPDGKVPVCSMAFQEARLAGDGRNEQVVLVAWNALSEDQKERVLSKIGARSGASKDAVLRDIRKIGLPLRKRYTTGVIAAELRFFI